MGLGTDFGKEWIIYDVGGSRTVVCIVFLVLFLSFGFGFGFSWVLGLDWIREICFTEVG